MKDDKEIDRIINIMNQQIDVNDKFDNYSVDTDL